MIDLFNDCDSFVTELEGRCSDLEADQRRLEFVMEHRAKLGSAMDDRYYLYLCEYEGPPDEGYDNWRDAIDQAMKEAE